MQTSNLLPTTLAQIQDGWAIFWIVVAALVLLLVLLIVYRFSPDFARYMRIKRM